LRSDCRSLSGHDTTAITLSFALYEVARHPDVYRRVCDEVRRVCGDGMPTAEQLQELPYMTQVLKVRRDKAQAKRVSTISQHRIVCLILCKHLLR
jgi:hypothetical protein